jgi:hypothetical protein
MDIVGDPSLDDVSIQSVSLTVVSRSLGSVQEPRRDPPEGALMNIHHLAFSHTWALRLTIKLEKGYNSAVSERAVVSLCLWFR